MSVSLFIEGGGVRSFYSLGILSRMHDEGIRLPYVVGVSSGTLACAHYVAGPTGAGFARQLAAMPRKFNPAALLHPRQGLLATDKMIRHTVPDALLERVLESPSRFYLAATRAATAELSWWCAQDCSDIDELRSKITASCSIPVVMPVCRVQGDVYVDGGIRDSIPLDQAERAGFTHHVAVLTRPRGYRKSRQFLDLYLRHWLRPYPLLKRAMLQRHGHYNAAMKRVEAAEDMGHALVFRPPAKLMGRFEINLDKIDYAYQCGRTDCGQKLAQLISFLDAHT